MGCPSGIIRRPSGYRAVSSGDHKLSETLNWTKFCGRFTIICLSFTIILVYLNFPRFSDTDMHEQTVPTQIRLLLEEHSDQRQHCLPFHLHLLEAILLFDATLLQ